MSTTSEHFREEIAYLQEALEWEESQQEFYNGVKKKYDRHLRDHPGDERIARRKVLIEECLEHGRAIMANLRGLINQTSEKFAEACAEEAGRG